MDVEAHTDCRRYFAIVNRSYRLGDPNAERSFVLEVDSVLRVMKGCFYNLTKQDAFGLWAAAVS